MASPSSSMRTAVLLPPLIFILPQFHITKCTCFISSFHNKVIFRYNIRYMKRGLKRYLSLVNTHISHRRFPVPLGEHSVEYLYVAGLSLLHGIELIIEKTIQKHNVTFNISCFTKKIQNSFTFSAQRLFGSFCDVTNRLSVNSHRSTLIKPFAKHHFEGKSKSPQILSAHH